MQREGTTRKPGRSGGAWLVTDFEYRHRPNPLGNRLPTYVFAYSCGRDYPWGLRLSAATHLRCAADLARQPAGAWGVVFVPEPSVNLVTYPLVFIPIEIAMTVGGVCRGAGWRRRGEEQAGGAEGRSRGEEQRGGT